MTHDTEEIAPPFPSEEGKAVNEAPDGSSYFDKPDQRRAQGRELNGHIREALRAVGMKNVDVGFVLHGDADAHFIIRKTTCGREIVRQYVVSPSDWKWAAEHPRKFAERLAARFSREYEEAVKESADGHTSPHHDADAFLHWRTNSNESSELLQHAVDYAVRHGQRVFIHGDWSDTPEETEGVDMKGCTLRPVTERFVVDPPPRGEREEISLEEVTEALEDILYRSESEEKAHFDLHALLARLQRVQNGDLATSNVVG